MYYTVGGGAEVRFAQYYFNNQRAIITLQELLSKQGCHLEKKTERKNPREEQQSAVVVSTEPLLETIGCVSSRE